MPKKEVDYSNTIIYKIICRDKNIPDYYIGHTTNIVQRKYQHKSACSNPYNNSLDIYSDIRKNGGWDNWAVVELYKMSCTSKLNAIERTKEYISKIEAAKHIIVNPEIEPIYDNKLSCDACGYFTDSQKDFKKHESTSKHLKNVLHFVTNPVTEKSPKFKINAYCKNCNEGFNNRVSLWRHSKNCSYVSCNEVDEKKDTQQIDKNVVMELIKQNKELQNVLIEQNNSIMEQNNKLIEISKQNTLIQNNTTNNTTNNNHFNLNFFLNEQCKNAIDINEFIDSLNLNIADLENTGKMGYVLGISRIFINKLKELDVYTRPLHCTDSKRETVYIKDQNAWEKENDKSKFKKIVNQIARKNLQQIPVWQAQNPNYKTLNTPENEEFMKISLSSLGSYNEEDENKDVDKIIKNVLKEVVINKT